MTAHYSEIVFPVLVGAALHCRRQRDTHKRLMMIATAEPLTAGVGGTKLSCPWNLFQRRNECRGDRTRVPYIRHAFA
jgi:hypothetical protein